MLSKYHGINFILIKFKKKKKINYLFLQIGIFKYTISLYNNYHLI